VAGGNRRHRGQAERGADLVAGVDDPGGEAASIVLAIVLAFLFGYLLASLPPF
jgi:hypothetical protein